MKFGWMLLGALSVAAPAFGQSTDSSNGFASIDMNLSTFDLSRHDDNDSDFDEAAVYLPNGQARVRYGDFIGEIQGTFSSSVDDNDDDENSSSFGMIGHYVVGVGTGEAAISLGTMGGTNVEESDGSWYSLIGAGYAQDGWALGVGRMNLLGGQDSDDSLVNFTYLQASYAHDLNDKTSLFASGYYGSGKTDYDPTVTGYNIDLGVAHAVSDQMTFTASVGNFGVSNSSGGSNQAKGYSVNLGLNFAVGGASKQAKDAIRFDTPNLHREMTWCDEVGC